MATDTAPGGDQDRIIDTAACACPGCTGGPVCEGDGTSWPDCPGCISGDHGRDRRHRRLTDDRA